MDRYARNIVLTQFLFETERVEISYILHFILYVLKFV